MSDTEQATSNFIRFKIDQDLEKGRVKQVITRFPPEPNGYLHIGHAKSICLNFGLAKDYGGVCHLRFDDTNPAKEEDQYVKAIAEDIKWLGFNAGDKVFFASDYYQQLHDYAVQLIKKGLAYVDSLSADEIREYRGTLTRPGTDSPYRNRSVEENLLLFADMKAGKYADGELLLRAKIDMAAPNLNMRDPALYRIRHIAHHRTGNEWCIYPMYDFAHGLSDAIEGITHSLCTLEFEDHRPLYDWFLEALDLPLPRPEQTEFARLNLAYTLMSKRKLLNLVTSKTVEGWDDPRMPTISGMRRRGYPAAAIRDFCERIGVARANSLVDFKLLAYSLRDELNRVAQRRMAVFDPLKVVVTNLDADQPETIVAVNNPENEDDGKREMLFTREIYIEREDFRIEANKKYRRLVPGREVRFLHAFYLHCTGYDLDENGEVSVVYCTYDASTRGGWSEDGRKVKGTIHWVSASEAVKMTVNQYNNLYLDEVPQDDAPVNPESKVVAEVLAEPSLAAGEQGVHYQFVRDGYYFVDSASGQNGAAPIYNQTIGLKDSWAKIENKG